MKKEMLIVSALTAFSVFALDSNEIAILPRDISAIPTSVSPSTSSKNIMLLTVPFNGYSTGSSEKLVVAEVLQTYGLASGDRLFTQVSGQKGAYNAYALNGSGQWVAQKKVTIENGVPVAGSADSAGEAEVARGEAFWLETAATSVKLLGQSAGQEKTATAVVSGYQLLAPTTSENDLVITETFTSVKGATKGDNIILADGTRYQFTANGWRNVAARTTPLTVADKIKAGTGFWYRAADNTSRSFDL